MTDWSRSIGMRHYRVEIGDHAEQDLENIGDYIAGVLHSPLTAVRMVQGIRTEGNTLQQLPERYELDTDPILAECGVRRTYYKEYNIFYIIDNTVMTVYIVRILHMRMNSRAALYQTLGIVAEPEPHEFS